MSRFYAWAQLPKRFTNYPFDAIPLDALSDFFTGGYPQPEVIETGVEYVYHEVAIPILIALLISTLEFPTFFQFFGILHDLVDIQILSPRRVAPAKMAVKLQIR